MELKNKKINFLGDSITEGCGTSAPERCFVTLLKERYQLAEARNYGIGGTRITPQGKRSENPQWDLDFCGRFDDMAEDADAVVVFGGTNDFGHGDIRLGNICDKTPVSFYGAYTYLLDGLQKKYPKTKILCVTPLHRDSEAVPKKIGQEGLYDGILADYAEAVRKVAALHDIPVLELFDFTGNPEAARMERRLFPDGLHPDDGGHVVLTDLIGKALENL